MSHLTLKPSLEQEFSIILAALKKVQFNKKKAAKLLGVHPKTLANKLKRYYEKYPETQN